MAGSRWFAALGWHAKHEKQMITRVPFCAWLASSSRYATGKPKGIYQRCEIPLHKTKQLELELTSVKTKRTRSLLQWKNPRQYGRNAILGLASRPLLEFI
jgi:hypothetical protein